MFFQLATSRNSTGLSADKRAIILQVSADRRAVGNICFQVSFSSESLRFYSFVFKPFKTLTELLERKNIYISTISRSYFPYAGEMWCVIQKNSFSWYIVPVLDNLKEERFWFRWTKNNSSLWNQLSLFFLLLLCCCFSVLKW